MKLGGKIRFKLGGALVFLSLLVWAQSAQAQESTDSEKEDFKKSKLTSDRSEGLADQRDLILATGIDKVVDLDFNPNSGAAGISIGNPKVVATTLVKVGDQRQIVFKPLASGKTTVTVRDNDGNVRLIFNVAVSGSNLERAKSELEFLLKDIEGIQFEIRGSRIFVDGEVLIPKDYGRLLTVIDGKNSPYTEIVVNLTTLSPLALQLLSRRIENDIKAFAPNVSSRVVNSQIWLEGTVDNFDMARRAEKVAELYLPSLKPGSQLEKDPTVQRLPPRSLVQNFIVINPPPPQKKEKLVRVTSHFVELSKNYAKVFGFKWQPGFTADPQINIGTTGDGSTGASGVSTFTATISSLFPKLQSAQRAGYARVLKTGTVVVRSGKVAVLNDETETPFPVTGPNGQVSTQTASTGLNLSVTPLILGQTEDIQMDLEMNQVNPAGRAAGRLITANHLVKTSTYIKSNESAAIAAVFATDVKTDFNEDDPNSGSFGGANTSPLFTLLNSKNFAKRRNHFVIFVTPQIIESASEGTDDLKKNFRIKIN